MIRRVLLTIALLVPTSVALAQPSSLEAAKTSGLKIEKITEKIHVIAGAGGNITVFSGDDGVLVVDAGVAASSAEVLEAIRSISTKPIRYVINTHWHQDHTGGNAIVGANATVVAHDRTRGRLQAPVAASGTTATAAPATATLPNLTIQTETRIYLNGETIQLIPLPGGHTDSDIVVSFAESGVVHLGDIFFAGRFPLIDTDSGATARQLGNNIDWLLQVTHKNSRIIPGHGPVSTVEDIKKFKTMLTETSTLVFDAKRRGESVETMRKNKLLDAWTGWSWETVPTDRYIEILFKAVPAVRQRGVPRPETAEPGSPAPPSPKKP